MPIEILMPALSPTMEEGTLSKWLVKEGDTVSSGDLLAEIETDKATMEIEAVEEGRVAKILVQGGTEGVKVNAPIAVLLEDEEDDSAMDGYSAGGGKAEPQAASAASVQSQEPETPKPAEKADAAPATRYASEPSSFNTAPSDKGDRIKASPLAKRLAKEAGIDLSSVSGSGPHGRIVKADIESYSPAKAAPKAPPQTEAPTAESKEVGPLRSGGADYLEKMGIVAGTYDLVPLDGMRRTIAKRLLASNNNVPDFPLVVDCEIDALLAMRKELNSQAPEGVKISVNDMLIRASALALKHVPNANASFTPDGIAYHKNADVAVAVAIDGGLITPIVREANNKGLSTISTEMKDLAGRAREKKLKPQEYQGGTFSISNLGMMGIKEFGSIVNEPHGMILSVGAGEPRPVVKEGEIVVATVMTVTLTCDHRVVDGALGAEWLQHFKRYVQSPITMML
ncbi:pyruvate dehydrogenase complex dihydrolipoamide acetyltransferase [Litorimonas sp. RW-G-Af-16]|uniref:pyruvate dehydrogenase complex dihydrolipoamide acetyltransferase n=1 Tax=Litorimonas sp. RW-G-Af-16 TaxID=3241168 RepID=UPI00390C8560